MYAIKHYELLAVTVGENLNGHFVIMKRETLTIV